MTNIYSRSKTEKRNTNRIRRGQLIEPFGVGAVFNSANGKSYVTAGLDYWHMSNPDRISHITSKSQHWQQVEDNKQNLNDFAIDDWRLRKVLRVAEFRLPPDFRKPTSSEDESNIGLEVPALVFPKWYICNQKTCRYMEKGMSTSTEPVRCEPCTEQRRQRQKDKRLSVNKTQVQFVVICKRGHIDDFPWSEWVHHSLNPLCRGAEHNKLQLKPGKDGTQDQALLICTECEAKRSMTGVRRGGPQTFLSQSLASGSENIFTCTGNRPWLGDNAYEECEEHVVAVLKGASNLYMANVVTSLYLPSTIDDPKGEEIENIIRNLPNGTFKDSIENTNADPSNLASSLKLFPHLEKKMEDFTVEQIATQIEICRGNAISFDDSEDEYDEMDYRHEELSIIKDPITINSQDLRTTPQNMTEYIPEFIVGVSNVVLVDKLKETRVLMGFHRLEQEGNISSRRAQEMMFINPPVNPKHKWLPAVQVHGEGILIELDEDRVRKWESQRQVKNRIASVIKHIKETGRNLPLRSGYSLTPRYFLVHTLSHMLINQLVFDCGYSASSLKERLYVSSREDNPSAALLIYTGSGGDDGTLGGLIRMGEPGNFEDVLHAVLDNAQWCSADPICSDQTGEDVPYLAACHSCAFVPETACEIFNNLLDRQLVKGNGMLEQDLGFFD